MVDASPRTGPRHAASPASASPGRGRTGGTGGQHSQRDPWLDNARAILITLVVIGHLIENVDVPSGDGLYLWIYSFHMPAFIAVSGYLSRSFTASDRQARALLATLIVPYFVFRLIHCVEEWAVTGETTWKLLSPSFALWFLPALFVWRLSSPVVRVLRYPLLYAVAVSLAVPFDPAIGNTLTLGRVFGFLPFFVLGLVARPEWLTALSRPVVRWVGGLVLLAGLVPAFLIGSDLNAEQLFLRESYESLGLTDVTGPPARLAVLAVGTIGTAAVLAASPRGASWISTIGRNSLTVYLLQAAIIFPLNVQDLPGPEWGGVGVAALVVIGVLLTVVLGSPLVERTTRWLVRPPTGWLLRPQSPATRA